MSVELTDVFRAAALIQWGLQPRVAPVQNAEYRELVREYLNRGEFRDVVSEMADGLGLYVLNVSEHGAVLSPREGGVFWMKASEFRPGNKSADARLLDGLVQVTIAATVFPRARDLEDDVNRPRPPVTVEEVDDVLRSVCARIKESALGAKDQEVGDFRAGLYDAWRVYDSMLSVRGTRDGRDASNTTVRVIKYNLERLRDFGCFTETKYAGREAWQPTRRYNVLVQELAASRLFDEVMRLKGGDAVVDDEDEGDADGGMPGVPGGGFVVDGYAGAETAGPETGAGAVGGEGPQWPDGTGVAQEPGPGVAVGDYDEDGRISFVDEDGDDNDGLGE